MFELKTFDIQWTQTEGFSELASSEGSRASAPEGNELGHSHQRENRINKYYHDGHTSHSPLKDHLSPPSSPFYAPPVNCYTNPYISLFRDRFI